MCTSWSSANQISNFKFSAFFRVLFALWSLKYPHPKSQQTPRVSTELEMVVNLLYSFIPFQKVSQKGDDRSVENRQKRAENIEMAPNSPNKLSWRMRNKMPLCYLLMQLIFLFHIFHHIFLWTCKHSSRHFCQPFFIFSLRLSQIEKIMIRLTTLRKGKSLLI